MLGRKNNLGFTLVEVIVAVAVFLIFAVGIYGTASFIFKIVYQSRMTILETALLSEELEVARNLPYESVGIVGGVPSGLLQHTKTVVRGGVAFNLVTVVRNIDDQFDGTVTSTPRDTSPADYKLVEISAICAACAQKKPVVFNTQVGPKGLEGSSKNGALFIKVFDAAGQPVVGANVHVVSVQPTSTITIDDVTDNDGHLNIIDTPTGSLSYAISVSKSGYSSDGTLEATEENPNPVKPPASVASQQITEISFAIDGFSSLTVHTKNIECSAIGNAGLNMQGEKLIGMEPDVYKFDTSFETEAGGLKNFSSLEWDNYTVTSSGTTYDIVGSIPMLPLVLNPNTEQDLSIILKPHTNNSLLVKVLDAETNLPLSGAKVQLTAGGYDESTFTGLGFARQTDWSDGAGATNFVEGRYYSDDGRIETESPAGDVKLKKTGSHYLADGSFESGTFDLGEIVNFSNVFVEPLNQPVETGNNSLLIQIATSNSSSPATWSFVGPDGTASSYYSPTDILIYSGSSGKRYMRYRVFLHTDDTSYSPQLSEIYFTYTRGCSPPGQAFFGSLSATTYTLDVSAAGYASSTDSIEVSDRTDVVINMVK